MAKPWRVYEYEGCSTCREALKFLDGRGVAYERVPIVERPPSRAELESLLARGLPLKRLFNVSGRLYREMKLGEKLPGMGRDEALFLLTRHGKLVKRPVVPEKGLVGFDEAEWAAALAR